MESKHRRRRRGLAQLLLSVGLIGAAACGSCESSSMSAPEESAAPVPRPESVRAQLSVRGGTRFLGALREQMGGGVTAAAAPRTSGDLLARMTDLPAGLEARVLPDSPIEGVLLGEAEAPHRAFAARVRLEPDAAHPLGPELPLGEACAGDAHWIGAGEAFAALAGDVLVIGNARDAVEEALPWLTTRAITGEQAEGITLELADGLASRSFHAIASATVDRRVADARRKLAAEASRHDGEPEVADPEAALRLVEQRARTLVALLPDVGVLRIRVTSESAGPTVNVHAAVAEDSPLADMIASYPAFATLDLARMPASSTLRLMAATAPPSGEDASSLLTTLLGDRLSADERGALEQLGEALHDGMGPRSLAAGMLEGQSFIAYFGHSESAAEVAPALRAAMHADWLKQGLGLGLGCGREPARVVTEGETVRLGGCSGDNARELFFARSGATRGLLLRRAGTEANLPTAEALMRAYVADPSASSLDPASQRLITALPETSLFAALLDPAQLMPSLAGLMGDPSAPSGASAPVALAVSTAPDGLQFRLVLAPGAAANIANIGLSLSR